MSTEWTWKQYQCDSLPKHYCYNTRPYNAYVKFNTKDLPGTNPSNFDLDIMAVTSENNIEIANQKLGKYYMYLKAYHLAISDNVVGGIPYVLTAISREVSINVPMVE